MAEYIERSEVERVLMEKYNRFAGMRPDFYAGFMAAYKVIEEETRSVYCKEVVGAEWVKTDLKDHDKCSNCGCLAWIDTDFDQSLPSPYCPNCGATMKGFDNG